MRSFAPLAVIVLTSTVLPTLAAPHAAHQYKREDATSALLARQAQPSAAPAAVNPSEQESGALWGALLRLVPTAISAVSGLFGNHKRELVDILARDELFASELLRRGVDFEDLIARADANNDESGAFWGILARLIPTAVSAISSAFHKRDFNPELLTRDLNEMFSRELEARDIQDPESGALFGALARFIPTAISAVSGLFGNHKREFNEELLAREFEEMYARELQARGVEADPESGALFGAIARLIPTAISAVSGLFGNHKREFDDQLLARSFDELVARANEDESGAIWGALLRLVPTAISAVSGLFGNHKREFDDSLFARDFDELMARADTNDESGAIWGALLRLVPTAISAVSGLFGSHKRELEDHIMARSIDEIVARAEAGDDESGAFLGALVRLIPTAVSAVSGLFGKNKRDFEENFVRELVARADAGDAESGAFLGLLAKAIPTVISVASGLFGGHKRAVDDLLARSDLDEHFIRELVARADAGDDESGAFLGLLARFIPTAISAVSGLFGGHKREFEDILYARGIASLNDLD